MVSARNPEPIFLTTRSDRGQKASLVQNVFLLNSVLELREDDDDFNLERMEAVPATKPRRKHRSAGLPRDIRSPLRQQWRVALVRRSGQCRPSVVADRHEPEILVW